MNSIFDYIKVIEETLKEYSSNLSKVPNLNAAMEYSLLAGGKRIRPLLVLASQKICNMPMEEIIPMAVSMEMIHTYSLIHDDLPAMDNDDLRRGKPTNHKIYGEALAILAGDALLNESFNLLLNNYATYTYGTKAILEITKSSGPNGMIAGQVIDMESEGKKINLDTLKLMHENKTGAIIKSSLTAPFILNNMPEDDLIKIGKIGENIGILFQVQDDILDVTSTTEIMGKTIGKDEKEQKSTYVSILGLEESKKYIDILYKDTLVLVDSFKENNEYLKEIIDYIYKRKN